MENNRTFGRNYQAIKPRVSQSGKNRTINKNSKIQGVFSNFLGSENKLPTA